MINKNQYYNSKSNYSAEHEHDIHCQRDPEISLFRAVILQSLLDSVSKSKRTEDKIAKKNAISWLSEKNRDFIEICNLAKMSPEWVSKKAKKVIESVCNNII